MTATETEATTDSVETQETQSEKTFTQSQLEAIVSRKEQKFNKSLSEMKEQLASLTANLTEAESKVQKTLTSEERLEKMQADYKKQLAKLENEKHELLQVQKAKSIDNELMRVVSKTTRPELAAKLLRDRVKVDDNNKVFAVNEHELPISLDELVVEFLKSYPEFAPSPPSGAGTNTGKVNANLPNVPPKGVFKSDYEFAKYMASKISG